MQRVKSGLVDTHAQQTVNDYRMLTGGQRRQLTGKYIAPAFNGESKNNCSYSYICRWP